MPCRDDRGNVHIEYVTGVDPHYREEAKRLQKRCDSLTDLLCKAGRSRYRKTDIPKEVLTWWNKHCEIDHNRGEPW